MLLEARASDWKDDHRDSPTVENTWLRIYLKMMGLLEVSNWCPEDQIQLAKGFFDNDNTRIF